MNLTAELNATTLLIPGRFSEVLSVLEPLEELADLNQDAVENLSKKVYTIWLRVYKYMHMYIMCVIYTFL